MESLLELIPEDKKDQGQLIIYNWKNEVSAKKKKPTTEGKETKYEIFKKKMEEYCEAQAPVLEFNVVEEDFKDIGNCVSLIKRLQSLDNPHHKDLLQSAAYQGQALQKILELCDNKKKEFVVKLKLFEISLSTSYCYFLIRLSRLFFAHQLIQSLPLPISFVRKHFHDIERFISEQNHVPAEEDDWVM